jgi:ribosomal protein S18 acetylase RimI-like enzyme
VQEENLAAQALYAKAGFHNAGLSRNYYGKGQNGIWMRKTRTRQSRERLFV